MARVGCAISDAQVCTNIDQLERHMRSYTSGCVTRFVTIITDSHLSIKNITLISQVFLCESLRGSGPTLHKPMSQ